MTNKKFSTKNRPNNNRYQNAQFNSALESVERKLGIKISKDDRREFHNFISGKEDLDYQGLYEEAYSYFDS